MGARSGAPRGSGPTGPATGTAEEAAGWWRTAVSETAPDVIRFRGYPVEQLIGRVSFVETAWLLLRGEFPTGAQARLLEAALVASVDHGPQAPSIAAARMAATCGVGLNSSVATGVGLLGDVHGGAGQQCMQLLVRVRAAAGDGAGLADVVAGELAGLRERRAHVPGFGHRFHARDPRRDPLVGLLRAAVEDGVVPGHHLAVLLEVERQLGGRRGTAVPVNVDGVTAALYCELGFAPELARGLFVLARSVGVLAHAWEETQAGTRIKGPLPPSFTAPYDGPPLRDLPDLGGDR
ncbi:citryl-CoA lyase [Geodermatophilus sp. DSM 45219]|uniref:citryl-CoA lyase n=1 Tax=Geodermatophilus sp. DSM 45219 TaxID=1881103 RepID=UPI000890DB8F|nr:citryl-CoA lyase [Geodermatophilus sp. DSM 45219]SDN56179.1 citrate synthase [Geodermatophilus sp. DSM 45219]